MKRIIYTVLACAGFLAMLTGTSKKRVPREAGSVPALTIPATTGWARTEVAGIRFLTPPGATVTRAEILNDVRVKLANGYELAFLPSATDIKNNPKHDMHMYYAPDAQIVLQEMGNGDECQAIACSSMPILGSLLCVNAWPHSNAECANIVAIVRSIEPL